jgi:hypothetical protein
VELKDFERVFHQTVTALRQTHSAAMVASAVLESFPRELPRSVRSVYDDVLHTLRDAIEGVVDAIPEETREAAKALPLADQPRHSVAIPIPPSPLAESMLYLIMSIGAARQPRLPEFAALLYAQDLITTLAHTDGFLHEAIIAVCRREPRILHRRKQVSVETILDAGSWEQLLTTMRQDYAFEFGWKTITDRLSQLVKEIGLHLPMDKESTALLEQAYQIRHLIVHSGSRVTREFIVRSGRSDASVGQPIAVQQAYASAVNAACVQLCSDVFVASAVKFFGANEKELLGTWSAGGRNLQVVL